MLGLLLFPVLALADVWICMETDGTTLYTDQARQGCQKQVTPPAVSRSPNQPPRTKRPLYWCQGRLVFGDIRDFPLRDECEPVSEAPPVRQDGKPAKPQPAVSLDQYGKSVDAFMDRYRKFLDCCASDPEGLDDLDELDREATALLRLMESNVSSNKIMLLAGRGIIIQVAEARDRLRALKKRLVYTNTILDRAETVDFEQAGQARRDAQRELEQIKREFRPTIVPSRAPTGLEIGVTPPAGQGIGRSGLSGDEIGTTPAVGPQIGDTPPFGAQIGQQPPAGPEIGTVPPTGPAIGNSSFNRPP